VYLGIDPGLAGGLAAVLIEERKRPVLLEAIDIPTSGEGPKRRVHVPRVLGFIAKHKPTQGVIERAQAMPDQGSSSGFIYGRAVGALEASVAGMQIPLRVIEPRKWKEFFGLIKTTKEDSRVYALGAFPDGEQYMLRKKDHGRAEAALIALYGSQL
jgi:crossover junction endodeoxyribonuclease RuvC